MAERRRNGPCECGSGKKAKRCCGVRRGPAAGELAKAFLAEQRRWATTRLMEVARADFEELFDQMVDLPAQEVSLQVRLPRLLSPELEALRLAIDDDDHETVDLLVGPALVQLDDPQRRGQLVGAVRTLADAGRVDPQVAALAVIDLAAPDSSLLRSSLLEALAVSIGAAGTPAGLLVVST